MRKLKLSCEYAWTISDIHSSQTDTSSYYKIGQISIHEVCIWLYLQVEPAVGAALLAWNAIASELDGDIRTVQ